MNRINGSTVAICILSLWAALTASSVAAQSPPRKNIPTIAKAANGAVVSIIVGDKDRPIALGTGFFISKNGAIMTNYHVIQNGDRAVAEFPDGRTVEIDGVLASNKARDVAIIKAHGDNFQTLTLGDSDRLEVGDEVVAIGSPHGLESTVSNGIVSAIRVVEEKGKFLQITAPISHGSSGGPLFNMAGQVVGITSSGIEEGENLNFAIPINDAKKLLLSPQRLVSLPNEPIRKEPLKEAKEVKPEDAPHETQQQRCDKKAGEFVRRYFTYEGVSPSGSYIVSVFSPRHPVCYVAIVFDKGWIGVQDATYGAGASESSFGNLAWIAVFEPPHSPSSSERKFWSKLDPNHPIDTTPKITCQFYSGGNNIPCDSKEDFDSALLGLFGLDMSRPSIPIR